MSLAEEIGQATLEVISEFGSPVTITRKGNNGTYDPAQGKRANTGDLTMSPKCVTEDKGRWIDGVVRGEKYLVMAAEGLTFIPAPGDRFTHGGRGFTVMDKGVNAIEVEGVAVAYEVWGVSG